MFRFEISSQLPGLDALYGDIVRDPAQIVALAQTSRAAAAQRGGPLCSVHMLSLPLRPPMPPSQGCERLHSPFGLLTFRARIIFLAVRWLENQKYSNETVVLQKRRKLNSDA